MPLDVVELTKDLISYNSVSQLSNVPVTRHVAQVLKSLDFKIEELPYTDANGVDKLSIVGKLGKGTGGLSLMSHDDVVPATNAHEWSGSPFEGRIDKGKLYGRGSADMKGPLTVGSELSCLVHLVEQNGKFRDVVVPLQEGGGSAGASLTRRIGAPEAIEDAVELFPLHADPVIAHRDGDRGRVAVDVGDDRPPLAVIDRVAEQMLPYRPDDKRDRDAA